MIEKIESYLLNRTSPAFDDKESLTAVDLVSKNTSKVNEIVDLINKFTTEIDTFVKEFANETNKDYEAFKVSVNQKIVDFIETVDLKLASQDKEIDESVKYIKENLGEYLISVVGPTLQELVDEGMLDGVVLQVFNTIQERLTTIEGTVTSLSDNLVNTNIQVSSHTTEIDGLNDSVEEIRGLHTELNAKVTDLTNDLGDTSLLHGDLSNSTNSVVGALNKERELRISDISSIEARVVTLEQNGGGSTSGGTTTGGTLTPHRHTEYIGLGMWNDAWMSTQQGNLSAVINGFFSATKGPNYSATGMIHFKFQSDDDPSVLYYTGYYVPAVGYRQDKYPTELVFYKVNFAGGRQYLNCKVTIQGQWNGEQFMATGVTTSCGTDLATTLNNMNTNINKKLDKSNFTVYYIGVGTIASGQSTGTGSLDFDDGYDYNNTIVEAYWYEYGNVKVFSDEVTVILDEGLGAIRGELRLNTPVGVDTSFNIVVALRKIV